MGKRLGATSVALASVLFGACGNDSTTDHRAEALASVKTYIDTQLSMMETCATSLQNHAPAADADGWNLTDDAAAVATMREDWRCLRNTYERVEAAIAVVFPDYDYSLDQRYDEFVSLMADPDPFDDQIVTGVHAVERILWAGEAPTATTEFEATLEFGATARTPATMDEANDFKTLLCERIVTEIGEMRTQFAPQALDTDAAFRGVISSMQEQAEKVNLAASGEDESRYAQHTLADMRANLAGGQEMYSRFRTWLMSVEGGAAIDEEIMAGFERIGAAYDAIAGDAVPAVPATWNPTSPSTEDLATPYGMLHTMLEEEADPDHEGSLAHEMDHAAEALGIPQDPE